MDWIQQGNLEQVKQYPLDAIDALDQEGLGLIHWATDRGQLAIVEYLIVKGANVNLVDSSHQTALHYAVLGEQYEICELLLRYHAKTDIQDEDGLVPNQLPTSDKILALFK